MLIMTAMIWVIVVCQKIDLDDKIRRTNIALDKRFGCEEEEEVQYLEIEDGAVNEECIRINGDGEDVEDNNILL